MSSIQALRKTYIEFLERIVEGKNIGFNEPPEKARAQRLLKYLKKVPENQAEIRVHQLFLRLCEAENTAVRELLGFWLEVLERQLKAFSIEGDIPENLGELVGSKFTIWPSLNVEIGPTETLSVIEKKYKSAFKEFLFRADKKDPWALAAINRKKQSNQDGISTLIALVAGTNYFLIYYHPDITIEDASSLLRDKYSWWMNK